jgi:hypothetical protein
MITVSILEKDDVILPTDWCRPLELISMSGGHSDGYSFSNQYSGHPENNVEWALAGYIFGVVWFQKPTTVGKLIKIMGMKYEFVRGEVPCDHQVKMRKK